MSGFLKVMIALLLTLPLSAYVAGTLVASQTEMPPTREPVVVEVSSVGGSDPSSTGSEPSPGEDSDRRDRDDDDHDDDDDVRVVHPTPHDVDDDHGGDRDRDDRDEKGDDRDDRDDNSGRGGDDHGGDDD